MTKRKMYMRMITASLLRRRSRMLVALLAIAIGATILSGLVTVYYDVPRQMQEQFRNYGANMIFVPGDEGEMDMEAIEQAVSVMPQDKVVGVAPYRYETVRVNEQPIIMAGTDIQGVKDTSPYWFIDGDWPKKSGEVLMGKETAELLGLSAGDSFKASYAPMTEDTGKQAESSAANTTNEDEFTIAGVLETGGSEEEYIYTELEDLEKLTEESGSLDVVELSVSGSQKVLSGYVDAIKEKTDKIAPRLVKRVTQSETTVLGKLQGLVFIVTVVVLALTMVCVATTMMAAVTERRSEIGLRKALGASNKSITWEFMGEGMMLGTIGGLVGAGLGFAFAQMVSRNVFNSSIHIMWWIVPATILASVIVTAVASLIPVRKATYIDPALVLKGE